MEHKVKQRSPEWFKLRRGVPLTASQFGDAVGVGKGKPFHFFQSVVKKSSEGNNEVDDVDIWQKEMMEHGNKMETVIREAYELLTGLRVQESGFWVPAEDSSMLGLIGASPDGVVVNSTDDSRAFGLVEFKAPVYRLYNKAGDRGGIPRHYMTQIQGQMAICGAPWCDFMAVCTKTKAIMLKRVFFQPRYWEHISSRLKLFCFALQEADIMRELGREVYSGAMTRRLQQQPMQDKAFPAEDVITVQDLLTCPAPAMFRGPSRKLLSFHILLGDSYHLPPALSRYSNGLLAKVDAEIQRKSPPKKKEDPPCRTRQDAAEAGLVCRQVFCEMDLPSPESPETVFGEGLGLFDRDLPSSSPTREDTADDLVEKTVQLSGSPAAAVAAAETSESNTIRLRSAAAKAPTQNTSPGRRAAAAAIQRDTASLKSCTAAKPLIQHVTPSGPSAQQTQQTPKSVPSAQQIPKTVPSAQQTPASGQSAHQTQQIPKSVPSAQQTPASGPSAIQAPASGQSGKEGDGLPGTSSPAASSSPSFSAASSTTSGRGGTRGLSSSPSRKLSRIVSRLQESAREGSSGGGNSSGTPLSSRGPPAVSGVAAVSPGVRAVAGGSSSSPQTSEAAVAAVAPRLLSSQPVTPLAGRGTPPADHATIRGQTAGRGASPAGRATIRGQTAARGLAAVRGQTAGIRLAAVRGQTAGISPAAAVRGQTATRGLAVVRGQTATRGLAAVRGQAPTAGETTGRGQTPTRGLAAVRGQTATRGQAATRGIVDARGQTATRGQTAARGRAAMERGSGRGQTSGRGQIAARGHRGRGQASGRGQSVEKGQAAVTAEATAKQPVAATAVTAQQPTKPVVVARSARDEWETTSSRGSSAEPAHPTAADSSAVKTSSAVQSMATRGQAGSRSATSPEALAAVRRVGLLGAAPSVGGLDSQRSAHVLSQSAGAGFVPPGLTLLSSGDTSDREQLRRIAEMLPKTVQTENKMAPAHPGHPNPLHDDKAQKRPHPQHSTILDVEPKKPFLAMPDRLRDRTPDRLTDRPPVPAQPVDFREAMALAAEDRSLIHRPWQGQSRDQHAPARNLDIDVQQFDRPSQSFETGVEGQRSRGWGDRERQQDSIHQRGPLFEERGVSRIQPVTDRERLQDSINQRGPLFEERGVSRIQSVTDRERLQDSIHQRGPLFEERGVSRIQSLTDRDRPQDSLHQRGLLFEERGVSRIQSLTDRDRLQDSIHQREPLLEERGASRIQSVTDRDLGGNQPRIFNYGHHERAVSDDFHQARGGAAHAQSQNPRSATLAQFDSVRRGALDLSEQQRRLEASSRDTFGGGLGVLEREGGGGAWRGQQLRHLQQLQQQTLWRQLQPQAELRTQVVRGGGAWLGGGQPLSAEGQHRENQRAAGLDLQGHMMDRRYPPGAMDPRLGGGPNVDLTGGDSSSAQSQFPRGFPPGQRRPFDF